MDAVSVALVPDYARFERESLMVAMSPGCCLLAYSVLLSLLSGTRVAYCFCSAILNYLLDTTELLRCSYCLIAAMATDLDRRVQAMNLTVGRSDSVITVIKAPPVLR
jgi:hypothetical protein